MRRTSWIDLAAALALALALAACVSAAPGATNGPAGAPEPGTEAPGQTTAAAVAESAAVPDSAPAGAVAAGAGAAPDILTGTDRCQTRAAPADRDPASTPFVCNRTTNDPRMNGQLVGTVTTVLGDPAVSMTIGQFTLANAGGSWECSEASVGPGSAKVVARDQICLGHGGYIGLTAYLHRLVDEGGFTMGIVGSIEKTP